MIRTINPFTNTVITTYNLDSEHTINTTVDNAKSEFINWQKTTIKKRCKLLKKLSDVLTERRHTYAALITSEMGKPINQSLNEIDKCAWVCDFYAKNAKQFLADELIKTDATESFISKDPLGPILAVMPWNFPFWQVIRFVAPTLTAGNTVILKHASNVTGCSLAIAQLLRDAGYPSYCLQAIIATHNTVAQLIAHPVICGVSVTGSEVAGRTIAQIAGKYLKKTLLELGGNNACVIWEDANLEKHIHAIVQARMQNTGQSCIAAKRYIVVDAIYDKFIALLNTHVQQLVTGDPLNIETEIGVIARKNLTDILQSQVDESIHSGATVLCGNQRRDNYFKPTILENVKPGMPAFDDELFGPVASVIRAKDRTDSIALAIQSKFGLGTMLFTEDIDAAHKLISEIPDGSFFVNSIIKSHPQLPFGGTKASGFGRELSKEGILAFVNIKTVYVNSEL